MKRIIFIAVFGLGTMLLSAQSDLSLYNFNGIAQSLHTNPAYPQKTRVWVGLPALSGVQFSYQNNGFKLIDLFETGTDVNENIDNIIMELDGKSQLAVNTSIDLLGVGFRFKGGFLTVGAQQVGDYKMTYPVGLLKLINFGNAPQEFRNSDLSDFDFESMSRTNYYVGYQHPINDKLTVGGKLKYIKGQGHSYVERMNASIVTNDNSSIDIESDIVIRTAGISDYIDENPINAGHSAFPANNGLGVDLGAYYQYNDHWNFSASVLDLGFISWGANTREYVSNGSFVYDGFEADLSKDQPVESFDQIIDSLKDAFNFKEINGNSYTKALGSRVFLSANYSINKKHTFGALYQMKFWNGSTTHDISLNYQGRLADAFHYTVCYSIINGTYANLGAGFQAKLGPVQLYVLSDNFVHLLAYENLEATNVRAGLNICLYDKKDKKRRKQEDLKNIETDPIPADSELNNN